MQIDLPPDLEVKLDRIAAERGKNREALVFEAVEQLVGYNEWFTLEVKKGLAATEDELIEHRDVLAMIDQRYPDSRN